MKLACRVEEESQSEVLTKKAQVAKGKGKARATPTVAEDHIPGLVDELLRLLVDEARHTNALLFNLGADIAENTKLVGDLENLLFKICRSQGLVGELPGELDMSRKVVGMDGSEWFPKIGVSCLRCKK